MNKQAEHLNLVGHKSKWKNIHKFVLCIIDMHNNHFHIIKPIAAFDYSLTSFIVGISVFFVMSFILILNTQFGDPQVDTTVFNPTNYEAIYPENHNENCNGAISMLGLICISFFFFWPCYSAWLQHNFGALKKNMHVFDQLYICGFVLQVPIAVCISLWCVCGVLGSYASKAVIKVGRGQIMLKKA